MKIRKRQMMAKAVQLFQRLSRKCASPKGLQYLKGPSKCLCFTFDISPSVGPSLDFTVIPLREYSRKFWDGLPSGVCVGSHDWSMSCELVHSQWRRTLKHCALLQIYIDLPCTIQWYDMIQYNMIWYDAICTWHSYAHYLYIMHSTKGRVHVTHHSRHEGRQWPRICRFRRFHHLEEIEHGEGFSVWTSPVNSAVFVDILWSAHKCTTVTTRIAKLRKVRVTTSPSSTSSKRMRWSPTWNSSVPRPNLCAFCSGIQHLTTSFSSATAEITPTSHCKRQPHCCTQLCKTSSLWGFISLLKNLSVYVCTKKSVFLSFSLFPKVGHLANLALSVWVFGIRVELLSFGEGRLIGIHIELIHDKSHFAHGSTFQFGNDFTDGRVLPELEVALVGQKKTCLNVVHWKKGT